MSTAEQPPLSRHCGQGLPAPVRRSTRRLVFVGTLAGLLVLPAYSVLAQGTSGIRVVVPDVILADPGESIDLSISVEPAGSVPDKAFIRIKGLPQRVSLNAGYLVSPGTWAVPLAAAKGLMLTMPEDLTARAEIVVMLADVDGRIHAEKQSRLIVARTGGSVPQAMAQAGTIAIPTLAVPLLPVPSPRVGKAPDAKAKAPVELVYALPALPAEAQLKIPVAVRLELEQILSEGDQSLIAGDVEFARRIYRLVTERGLGLAAIKMAETFDPYERARLKIADEAENTGLARAWYRRAIDLGERRAVERLKRLEAH